MSNAPRVAIIGGGVAGLVAAYRLLHSGAHVTLFERSDQLGGQLVTTEVHGTRIEHYYHHAFTSDTALWALCDELGLADTIRWLPSTMGYYSNGQLFRFGTPSSLLAFSPLGVWGRLQFIVSSLWIAFGLSQAKSEQESAKSWFYRRGFKTAWDIVWEPLFKLKFGATSDHIGLTWLWGKLKTRGTSRQKSAKEVLAYMEGSFGRLVDRLEDEICRLGGDIRRGTATGMIGDGPTVDGVSYDAVIATVSADVMAKSASWTPEFRATLQSYRYQAAICVMIVTRHNPCPFYWTNVGDSQLPFGGVIAHTGWVSPTDYGGHHVIYLSRYLDDADPLFSEPDATISTLFMTGLNTMLPDWDAESVTEVRVFRQRNAQPIVPVGYSPPPLKTELDKVLWISTHHTYPFDRGMNYAIECADKAVAVLKRDLALD